MKSSNFVQSSNTWGYHAEIITTCRTIGEALPQCICLLEEQLGKEK